jgi:hypothetical protein
VYEHFKILWSIVSKQSCSMMEAYGLAVITRNKVVIGL